MPVLSHLHQLFNAEQCQAYIRTLRWKDRPLQCGVPGATTGKCTVVPCYSTYILYVVHHQPTLSRCSERKNRLSSAACFNGIKKLQGRGVKWNGFTSSVSIT